MLTTSFKLSAAIAGLLFLVGQAIAARPAEITLRREAQLSSPVVRLGDVAEVVSADSHRSKALSTMVLMPAPAPGTNLFLMRRELQDLVAAHGESLSELRFAGTDRVAISSAVGSGAAPTGHHDISGEAERRAAMPEETPTQSPANSLRTDSQVQQFDLESAIGDYLNTVTEKSAGWKISLDLTERHWQQLASATSTPICSGGHEPWTGAQRFVLSFSTKKGSAHLPVYAEVARPEPVVVAIRAIERGMTITAADVEVQFMEAAATPSGRTELIRSAENIIGLEANRAIDDGDLLTTEHAKAPLLVKRGEEIAVIAQGGGIRIRATARARQDGAHGDLIQVESLETRDRYDARVTGLGEVTVFSSLGPKVAGRSVTGRRF